jgi:hypothetical protein
MRCRFNRAFVARLMLASMLYTQAALALAPCEELGRSAARAIAESAQTCHEPEQSPNLCVSECLAGDQNQYTPAIPLLAPPAAPVLVATASIPQPIAGRFFSLPLRATHPPPRILFQTFLI